MMKWVVRIVFVAALAGLGFWAWTWFFPKQEVVIRHRLQRVAQLASFSSNESALSKAAAPLQLVEMFTPDVEVSVDVQGLPRQTLSGKDNLQETAIAVRQRLNGLNVEFLDITTTLAPSKLSAEVSLTAKIKIPSEKEFFPQELKFSLKKVGGKWLIRKIETVKTLS